MSIAERDLALWLKIFPPKPVIWIPLADFFDGAGRPKARP